MHYFKATVLRCVLASALLFSLLLFNIISSFLLLFLLFRVNVIMSPSEPDSNAQAQENWPQTLQSRRVSVTWGP